MQRLIFKRADMGKLPARRRGRHNVVDPATFAFQRFDQCDVELPVGPAQVVAENRTSCGGFCPDPLKEFARRFTPAALKPGAVCILFNSFYRPCANAVASIIWHDRSIVAKAESKTLKIPSMQRFSLLNLTASGSIAPCDYCDLPVNIERMRESRAVTGSFNDAKSMCWRFDGESQRSS